MKNKSSNFPPFFLVILLILLVAISRFIPHPFNFTAVGAMALFAGANMSNKKAAYLIPFIIMFLSDLLLGFHFSILPVYACFAFTVWMGIKISGKQNLLSVFSASLISSIVFFLVTNLPFWYADLSLYPLTFDGLKQSYFMGLPFFRNQVLGDLFYNGLLFGTAYLLQSQSGLAFVRKENR